MMTTIYFVRHAHSIYTPDELGRPLSAKGLKDAKHITELLREKDIDLVYSSPYKRAIQTVHGIAQHISKHIILEDNFKERRLSVDPVEDFQAAIERVWHDDSFSFPGGESNRDAQKRGCKALKNILAENERKNIVIGTHGNIMVLMMSYFDKTYGYQFWRTLEMPDIYKLVFKNFSLIDVQRIWK
ncbi:2,3-bisphosphoglycerate-dependent phosphoglycerate mutase [Ornithinibacillus bavariensis]